MGNINKGNPFIDFIKKLFIITTLDKVLVYFIRGHSSVSLIGKLAPNNYQYKSNTYRTFYFKNIKLHVDISDYVGHYLYYGFYDVAHIKLLNLIKKGDMVLDVGTNIGSTLLQFANKVSNKGKVYGFEPDLKNYNESLNNISLNNFNNIEINNIGLGSIKGNFKLIIDTPTNRGGNRIATSIDDKEYIEIKVERLDDWILDKKLEKISLIKIDVEGYEYHVLKGGEKTIKQYKPILFIELDDTNLRDQNSTGNELVLFLETLQYKIYNVETQEIVSSKDNFIHCHFDIVCYPNK